MGNTERVTVYLSEAERLALQRAAQRIGSSENYTLKLLLRHHLELELTEFQETQLNYLLNLA